MEPSYISPVVLSNAVIQTEEQFLAHARNVLTSLQRFQLIMGSSGPDLSLLKAAMEELLKTVVRPICPRFLFIAEH
jgi:hypothetical protein